MYLLVTSHEFNNVTKFTKCGIGWSCLEWKRLSIHLPPASTFLKSFCPNDVILWCHMTGWRHAVTVHDFLTSHCSPGFCIMPLNQKQVSRTAGNHIFSPGDLDLWPITLPWLHRTWPRYGQGWPTCKISCWYVNRFSCESTDTHRHTRTHRRLRFYNLDRWRGR